MVNDQQSGAYHGEAMGTGHRAPFAQERVPGVDSVRAHDTGKEPGERLFGGSGNVYSEPPGNGSGQDGQGGSRGQGAGSRARHELPFVTPQGVHHTLHVQLGPDRPRLVRPPVLARPVQSEEWKGVQVRLPASESGNHIAYSLLEAETAAALALHCGYGGTRFRGLFPVPVGYDMNAPEPFILYAAPRGRPVSALNQGVSTGDQRIIERDLVLAVRLMEVVGLVHQGIVPAAVRWDGQGAQLWDLGSITRIGRPRTPCGVPPFASPEQRTGVGETDARDALWSVGQVLHQIVTGRPGSADGPSPDLARHRSLAQTLTPVFAPLATGRPSAAALLDRLMPGADTQALNTALPDPLEPYRRDFDAAMGRKHASLVRAGRNTGTGPAPPDYPPGPTDSKGRRSARRQQDDWHVGGSTTPDGPGRGSRGDQHR
ncbi:hypothetical protein [Streptomyces albipurpureus]|uniref:Protein kinase domain-containing protein n=1 Tax=Streptomyces albipurpureus TaxID=2897419 RepID=A0ABT0UJN1_9ACTN|nr:hypothetical protein [Streptomyces sp. CWNU-1]MCM2388843.1 hypothetical protein [Streptomyces sp. CWNU-1]